MQCRRYCREEGLATHSRKPACRDDAPGIPAPILGAHSMCSPGVTWIPLGSLLVVQISCGCRCFTHSKQRGTKSRKVRRIFRKKYFSTFILFHLLLRTLRPLAPSTLRHESSFSNTPNFSFQLLTKTLLPYTFTLFTAPRLSTLDPRRPPPPSQTSARCRRQRGGDGRIPVGYSFVPGRR